MMSSWSSFYNVSWPNISQWGPTPLWTSEAATAARSTQKLSDQIMVIIQSGANANLHIYRDYNDYGVNPGMLTEAPHRFPTSHHQSIAHPKYVYVPPRLLSPQFTGQEVYLDKLRTYFGPTTGQPSQRRFLLHGKGGVGKTQLALKYAEENADRYVDSASKSISWNPWFV